MWRSWDWLLVMWQLSDRLFLPFTRQRRGRFVLEVKAEAKDSLRATVLHRRDRLEVTSSGGCPSQPRPSCHHNPTLVPNLVQTDNFLKVFSSSPLRAWMVFRCKRGHGEANRVSACVLSIITQVNARLGRCGRLAFSPSYCQAPAIGVKVRHYARGIKKYHLKQEYQIPITSCATSWGTNLIRPVLIL
jgi:hypothetical protein